MAKKSEAKEAKKDKSGRKVLEAARKHQDALQAAGLASSVIDKYETVLKALEGKGKELNASATVLVRDIRGSIDEFQKAMRKEFPTNATFHAFFKADEPMPDDPHAILALAREIARQAPDFASNMIKHALNAASVKHLAFLADQLEREIGGDDPQRVAREHEQVILEVAQRAFEGKRELAEFK